MRTLFSKEIPLSFQKTLSWTVYCPRMRNPNHAHDRSDHKTHPLSYQRKTKPNRGKLCHQRWNAESRSSKLHKTRSRIWHESPRSPPLRKSWRNQTAKIWKYQFFRLLISHVAQIKRLQLRTDRTWAISPERIYTLRPKFHNPLMRDWSHFHKMRNNNFRRSQSRRWNQWTR